jgi:transformation/transcription domain-associated protein
VFPEDGQELTLKTYVRNLRKWRDHFEEMLDQRPQRMYLEHFSPWLSDFQFQKFDEVEVPGQYLQVIHCGFDLIDSTRTTMPTLSRLIGYYR